MEEVMKMSALVKSAGIRCVIYNTRLIPVLWKVIKY